ncbi:MAG: heavy-metal-associated domain-containing protein [Patescibacteria group bacterium]|nr:heavy-metal-associated domain-containing protein [Patescibacteria group bacterium]
MITKRVFKINGMHCTACAMNIDGDLEEAVGVKSASTNYARQETAVEYDDAQIAPEAIVEIIKKTGYEASL